VTNTIFLKGNGLIKEAVAAAAGILPGHTLDLTLNAGVLEVGVGAIAGALDAGRAAFAVENSEIGNDPTDVYVDDSQVKYLAAHKGDEVQARAAVGLTWATGAPLYRAAAGQVTDVPGAGIQAFGYALSDVAGSSADDLVPMEVA
jgi:hypothetical protein